MERSAREGEREEEAPHRIQGNICVRRLERGRGTLYKERERERKDDFAEDRITHASA